MTPFFAAINPYWGKNFFSFFWVFFHRMSLLCQGKLPIKDLASDEIQFFVLGLVALSSALIGAFLVLKKMTMLANSLSHTILLGIIISYLIVSSVSGGSMELLDGISLQVLIIASLITALLTAVLTQGLTHLMKLQEDASIGLVFTTLFALGIVLATIFTRNTHIGTEAIMGNVDALHIHDLKLISVIAAIDFLVVFFLFKEFKMVAFDGALTRALGFSPSLFNYLLMVLTAATVIGAFRAVGVLLVLAFLVGPVLTARLLTHSLKKMMALSVIIGLLCSLCAIALSRHLLSVCRMPLSTAGLVVTLMGVAYLLAILFAPEQGIIPKWRNRRRCQIL